MANTIRRLQKNVKQKDGSFITEHYETDATIVEYDSANSGLECANTQEAIDKLAKQQKVIEGNIISETTYQRKELTIPIEGWTDAAIGQYAKKVSVPVLDLKITDIIEGEVTLDTEEFAQECKLAYQCECAENSVTFFSATIPTSPIKINYYILQGKNGNISLGKIVYTSSEVVDGFESNSVTKSGSANNDMILNKEVNSNKEDIADLVKQLTEINGKLSALGTTDTDLQTQISELNKNIGMNNKYFVGDNIDDALKTLYPNIQWRTNYNFVWRSETGSSLIGGGSALVQGYYADENYETQMLLSYSSKIPIAIRYKIAGVWKDWDKLVLNNELNDYWRFYGGTEIAKYSDLDDVINFGNYYCHANVDVATLTNCPTNQAFTMKVYSGTGSESRQYLIQELTTHNEARKYTRTCFIYSDGRKEWREWKKIATTNDIQQSFQRENVPLDKLVQNIFYELPCDGDIHLCNTWGGSNIILIVQKYSDHNYGSIFVFGYFNSLQYYRVQSGTWKKFEPSMSEVSLVLG